MEYTMADWKIGIRYEVLPSVVVECRYLSGPAEEVLPRSAEYLRALVREP
jgi:N-acetylmuramoyl-L-alanine amidase